MAQALDIQTCTKNTVHSRIVYLDKMIHRLFVFVFTNGPNSLVYTLVHIPKKCFLLYFFVWVFVKYHDCFSLFIRSFVTVSRSFTQYTQLLGQSMCLRSIYYVVSNFSVHKTSGENDVDDVVNQLCIWCLR